MRTSCHLFLSSGLLIKEETNLSGGNSFCNSRPHALKMSSQVFLCQINFIIGSFSFYHNKYAFDGY